MSEDEDEETAVEALTVEYLKPIIDRKRADKEFMARIDRITHDHAELLERLRDG